MFWFWVDNYSTAVVLFLKADWIVALDKNRPAKLVARTFVFSTVTTDPTHPQTLEKRSFCWVCPLARLFSHLFFMLHAVLLGAPSFDDNHGHTHC